MLISDYNGRDIHVEVNSEGRVVSEPKGGSIGIGTGYREAFMKIVEDFNNPQY